MRYRASSCPMKFGHAWMAWKGEEGRAMGVEIAKELLDAAMQYFNGIYLMTPFLAYEMSVDLTKYVWEKSKRHDFHLYPLSK